MKASQLGHSLILLLTAVIWGVAFVAQSVGMDYVGPFTFTCARSLIGGLVLLPCIALLNRMNGQKENDRKAAAEKLSEEEKRKKRKRCPENPAQRFFCILFSRVLFLRKEKFHRLKIQERTHRTRSQVYKASLK